MANVKITLEANEDETQAKEALIKAFEHQLSGDTHAEASFKQPVAQDVLNRMDQAHRKMWRDMLNEINETLEAEV